MHCNDGYTYCKGADDCLCSCAGCLEAVQGESPDRPVPVDLLAGCPWFKAAERRRYSAFWILLIVPWSMLS